MSESGEPVSVSVLLAEDDPSALQVLAFALRSAGYAVECAPDGARALEALDRSRHDLFVLDILMPGATGWEVLARALQITPPGQPLPRVILMTGFHQEFVLDMELLRREGASSMLLKPFKASVLLDEARRVLALEPSYSLPRPAGETRVP